MYSLQAQARIKLLQFSVFIYSTKFTSLTSGIKQEFVVLSAIKNTLKTSKKLGHVTIADKEDNSQTSSRQTTSLDDTKGQEIGQYEQWN